MADRGLCEHLVRVALIECVELPGLTIAKKLKIRTRGIEFLSKLISLFVIKRKINISSYN